MSSITIRTNIDTKNATTQLTSLENRIVKTTDNIEKMEAQLKELSDTPAESEDLKAINDQIEKAERDMAKLQDRMDKFLETGGKTDSKTFEKMRYDAAELENTLVYARSEKEELLNAGGGYVSNVGTEKYDALAKKIQYARNDLDLLNRKHDELASKEKLVNRLGIAFDKVRNRVIKLATRLFIFSQITKLFRSMIKGMQEGFENLVHYSSEYNNAMSQLKSRQAELKNNMAAAFAPILQWIIPVLADLCGWLSTAAELMSKFFAALSGKSTYTKASKQAINYAKSVDKATKAQKGMLASFDDLNVLQKNGSGGGTGGGETTGAGAFEEGQISDDFLKKIQLVKEILEAILPYAVAIGIALAAWKIFNLLTSLAAISPLLATILAVVLFIVGACLMIYNYIKMWQEGVNASNLLGYFTGLALVLGTLGFLFGKVGVGMGLVASGIDGLILAFKDINENGFTVENTILLIVSALSLLIGVFLIFGPAAAGVVAAVLLIGTAIGIVIDAVKDINENGMTSENVCKLVTAALIIVIATLVAFGAPAAAVVAAVILIIGIFAKLVSWSGNGKEALGHLTEAFKKLGDFISKIFAGDVEGAFEDLKEAGKDFGNFFITVAEGIAKAFVKMVNCIVDAINSIEFGPVPDWVPLIGGKSFHLNIPHWEKQVSIPRLANGGVTTGSTLAQIGEAGREVVLPLENNLDYLRPLVDEIAGAVAGIGSGKAVLMVDGRELGEVVFPLVQNENKRIGTNLVVK